MRTKAVVPLVAVILAACTAGGQDPGGPAGPDNVLLLGSDHGVASIDPASGAVVFEARGVPALGDWSTVFTTSTSQGSTVLERRDSATGQVVSSVPVPGDLAIRVVSSDGSLAALMPPLPEGQSPWSPVPRAFTTIRVVDLHGDAAPKHYRLRGNLEPEAFSTDGRSLFLIRFVPPTAPEAYRVARLDLALGDVTRVAAGGKSVVESMRGTRLEQLPSADGTMLYTLYSTETPEYFESSASAGPARPIAFVHTLSLDQGWALCVGLPKAFWGGDPADQAMALSPNDRRLYVVDTSRGMAAVMKTRKTWIEEPVEVDFGPTGTGDTRAVVTPDGSALYVSSGPRIVKVDTATLQRSGEWTMDAPVTALGIGADGLYVAMAGSVEVIDLDTGRSVDAIPSTAVQGVAHVELLDR